MTLLRTRDGKPHTTVRHRTPPEPSGCRWCGFAERGHGQRWVPSHGWHGWVEPTAAQRKARMLARRKGAQGGR